MPAAEEISLILLMAVWVVVLPPGSLYFQATLRLLLTLLLTGIVALTTLSPGFFYMAGRSEALGVLAGILIRLFWIRRRPDRLFCAAMMQPAQACENYFSAVISYFCGETGIIPDNAVLEKLWSGLPQWVNAVGFDRRLQPGYQFFMQKLSDVGDVLFSLHSLARSAGSESPTVLHAGFRECAASVQYLFALIMATLRTDGDSTQTVPDFSENLRVLENAIRDWQPEVDDARRKRLLFADAACCLEDLRWLLLKLYEALTGTSQQAGQQSLLSPPVVDDQLPTQPTRRRKERGRGKKDSPVQN